MRKAIYVLLFCALGAGVLLFLSYNNDRQAAEAALLQMNGANLADREGLEKSFARAKTKALSIRSDELRDRTLAELTKEAMALMLNAQDELSSLNDARAKAEELLTKIRQ